MSDTCRHYDTDQGVCGTPAGVRLFLTGPRCPSHTPAALHGRPEAAPDPSATLEGLRSRDDVRTSYAVPYGTARTDPPRLNGGTVGG